MAAESPAPERATDIAVSDHAAARWDERTGADSIAPEAAWARAHRCPGVEPRIRGDEARYHPPTDALLLRRIGTIATVIGVADANDDGLRRAVRAQFGGGRDA